MRIAPWAIGIASVACGCAGAAGERSARGPSASAGNASATDDAARAQAFAKDEARVLDQLAAIDPRFAIRLGGKPGDAALRQTAVAALLAEDQDAMVHEGALDFFSFAARQRGLEAAAAIASRSAAPSSGGAAIERGLLLRLVDEERARLAEERDLPRGASELVRGIVETWGPPASLDAVKERDTWVARRLDQVAGALDRATLPHTELVELDDALDPLERLASPSEYAAAAAAIARLRVALGNLTPPRTRDASWPRVAAALQAHLGVTGGVPELRARLEAGRNALRSAIDARLKGARRPDDRVLLQGAEAIAFAPGRCSASAADSPVRALGPPPERAAICGALRALSDAKSDDALLIALVALDLETTAALWALAIHADGVDPDRAEERTRPMLAPPPEHEVRVLRLAVARPAVALGAGLAAELLTRHTETDIRTPARRWLSYGDAPLDIVARESLGAK